MKKVGFDSMLFTSLLLSLLLLFIVQSFMANVAFCQTYDVNGDGKVDILDILVWANAFGTVNGEEGFNPAVDVNSDNVIDIMDAVLISLHFGE